MIESEAPAAESSGAPSTGSLGEPTTGDPAASASAGVALIRPLCRLEMGACADRVIAVVSLVSSASRALVIGANLFSLITIAFAAIRVKAVHELVVTSEGYD